MGGGGEDIFGLGDLDEEEDLDLVAIDADLIRTMVETQEKILGKLDLLLQWNQHFAKVLGGMFELHKNIHAFMKQDIEGDKAIGESLKAINEMLGMLGEKILKEK